MAKKQIPICGYQLEEATLGLQQRSITHRCIKTLKVGINGEYLHTDGSIFHRCYCSKIYKERNPSNE